MKSSSVTYKNLATLFQNRVYRNEDDIAITRQLGKTQIALTWSEVGDAVREVGRVLLHLGVAPGERVGIYSENRPEAAIAEIASLSIGALTVLCLPDEPVDGIVRLLASQETRVVFVSHRERLDALTNKRKDLPRLQTIISMDDDVSNDAEGVETLSILRGRAKAVPAASFYERLEAIGSETVCTVLHPEKSDLRDPVKLNHSQLLAGCKAIIEAFPVLANDIHFSLLPLAGPFARVFGLYSVLYLGSRVAYPSDIRDPYTDLTALSPTVLTASPTALHRIRDHYLEAINQKPSPLRYLYRRVLGPNPAPSDPANVSPTGDTFIGRLLLPKIRKWLGGNLRMVVCVGDLLNDETRQFFRLLGVDVYETKPSNGDHLQFSFSSIERQTNKI